MYVSIGRYEEECIFNFYKNYYDFMKESVSNSYNGFNV